MRGDRLLLLFLREFSDGGEEAAIGRAHLDIC